MPVHYSFGLSVLHTQLRAGASVALCTASFPVEILDALSNSRATVLPGVPTLFQTLLERTALADQPLPFLGHVMVSGGKLSAELAVRLKQALPNVRLYLRYGVTEVTAGASILPPECWDKSPSIGNGLPQAPLRVLRADGTSVERGTGEVGEIVVQSDSVALGYLGSDGSESFKDGAFHSGDLATVDDEGYVFVVGRERSFIKTGGYRVAPPEVEETVTALPFVVEAAVCGVPHPLLGESVVCFVVVRAGTEGAVARLREHCKASLPSFKVPTRFELVSKLPRTSSGKTDTRQLVALASR
jgi:acyl-CoA synthetase (AMP-forming)/AMP-acid ligase II